MKFKCREGRSYRTIEVVDKDGDTLSIEAPVAHVADDDFLFTVNNGDAVLVTKRKARKLALAILAELDANP